MILKCQTCKKFTMEENCSCGGKAIVTNPPKYSPEDKYGEYRRKALRPELQEKGLL